MLLSIPVYEDAGLILKSSFLYKSTVIDDAHVFPSFEICKFSGADALNSGPVTSTEPVLENHAYDSVIKQANEIANIKKDDNIKFLFFFILAPFSERVRQLTFFECASKERSDYQKDSFYNQNNDVKTGNALTKLPEYHIF